MTMPLMRAAIVALCYVAVQVVAVNHFLYTLLKDRYLSYQISFYVVLFAASLLVSRLRYVSRGKWRVVLLMSVVGYLSGSVAFFIEPTLQFGLTRSPTFYRELFVAPVFSLGWFLGSLLGIAMVTLEPYIVGRFSHQLGRSRHPRPNRSSSG